MILRIVPEVYVCIWNYILPHKTINSWHLICRMSRSVSLLRKIVGTFYVIPSHLRAQFFPSIHRIRMRGVTGRMSPKIVDADVPQFSHSLLLFNIYFYIHWKRSIIPYHTLTYRKPLYQQNKSAMKEKKNNTQKSHILYSERIILCHMKIPSDSLSRHEWHRVPVSVTQT